MKKILLAVSLVWAVTACQLQQGTELVNPLKNPATTPGGPVLNIPDDLPLVPVVHGQGEIQYRYIPSATAGVFIFYTTRSFTASQYMEIRVDGKAMGRITKSWKNSEPPGSNAPLDGSVVFVRATAGKHSVGYFFNAGGGSTSEYYVANVPIDAWSYQPYRF
ncbi:hypothetical protein GCM10027347_37950 [Larkinella harenae]